MLNHTLFGIAVTFGKTQKMDIEAVKKLHQAGLLKKAKRGYLKLLKNNPKDVQALHLLSVIYVEEGEFGKAQHLLEEALLLNNQDPLLHLHLANVLKTEGLYSQAAQILLDLIELHPNLAAAFNNLGTIYYAQTKFPEAIWAYQIAIEKQSQFTDAYYNLGLVLNKLNRKEEALHAYQTLLEFAPLHVAARFQLGCLLMQKAKFHEAIKQFSFIEEEHPFHFETQTNLATCYLKLGHLNEAKVHYLQALDINAKDLQVLFNLGVINMQQGLLREAIHFYLNVVKVDADHYDAHNNLAFAYLTLKNHAAALLHFREALRLHPENKSIRHTISILSGEKNIEYSPPEYVRSLFDSYADHYEIHLKNALKYQVPNSIYQTLETLFKNYNYGDVLDLGCGTGLCGELFKSQVKSLIGIDLSEKMLDIAREKNIYDELIKTDILSFLQNQIKQFDLIIAGDVLVYFGKLTELFAAIAQALKTNGLFIFNTEISAQDNFHLSNSGRFAHQQNYLDEMLSKNRFKILQYKIIPMRTQNQELVYGHLYLVQKT